MSPCNSLTVKGSEISHLEFYRLSALENPDFVGTTGFECCIPPFLLLMLARDRERNLLVWIGALEIVEHVNG